MKIVAQNGNVERIEDFQTKLFLHLPFRSLFRQEPGIESLTGPQSAIFFLIYLFRRPTFLGTAIDTSSKTFQLFFLT